jgi:hypothetical protein
MPNLIGKKIVKNESDAERAFEKATAFLFEKKLNHSLIKQKGTEHSDGCMLFGNSNELLMWDNKTQETAYKFPNSHFNQFKKYIDNAYRNGKRVSCFLIIVPEIEKGAKENATKLKSYSVVDTDVSIITAENLKWLAEEWHKVKPEEKFNLQVFNTTGILTKEIIKERRKIFEG